MNADNKLLVGLLAPLHRVWRQWSPVVCIRKDGDGLRCEQLSAFGWQRVEAASLVNISPFARTALLMPDQECSFRRRYFAVDMVAAKDLDEAVALDVEQWSPIHAGEAIACLSLVERVGDRWGVSIWIWPAEAEGQMLARLPSGVQCTHVVPEIAWQAMQLRSDVPTLLIYSSSGHDGYAVVSATGVPQAICWPENEAESVRFWRSMGAQAQRVDRVWLCGDMAAKARPPAGLQAERLPAESPRLTLLSRARLEGVRDWSNPFTWRRPAAALCTLLLIWVLADAAVLTKRSEKLERTLAAAEQSAHDVLQQRDKADSLYLRLHRLSVLRQAQQRPERLLAALSRAVPDDIWLDIVQMDRAWIDINGHGKNVARLIVLLEKIDGVKQAILLNDIRPNAQTGLESFQLRLMLG